MAFPQSVLWGHLGVRSPAQFALMNPATYAAQGVYVDTGTALLFYYSDGLAWAQLPTPAQANAANKAAALSDPGPLGTIVGRATSLRVPSLARGLLTTLRTRIVAAGDTVSDAQLEALLDPLDRLLRSTAWPKLRELWIPVGSALAGSLVKLKADATAGTSMTGIGLVGGDYTVTTGITGNGSSKALNTGFNPTTAGVTASSWGFGAYVTNLTPSGIIAGTLTGAATYLAYSVSNDSKINGSAAVSHFPYPRWNAVQIGSGAVTTWSDGYNQTSSASATGSLDNSAITLLATNGAFWSSNTAAGWAAWTPALTADEMREVTRFFDSANLSLWRAAWQPTLLPCGDSNVTGFGLGSPTTQRWSALFAAALGLTENNQGFNNTCMSATGVGSGKAAQSWTGATGYKVANTLPYSGGFTPVLLGTNDERYGVTLDAFTSSYETWLGYQLQGGIDPAQLLLLSPPACTDALSSSTRQQLFRDAVQTLATKYALGYYDLWGLTNGVSAYFQADGIHLSVAGHAAAATALAAYLSTTVSSATLRRTPW